MLALCTGALHAGGHTLADQGALELRKPGHDGEHQLALGGRGVGAFLWADESTPRAWNSVRALMRACVDRAKRS